MTKEQAQKIFDSARYIFAQSRLTDVRRKAREIAMEIEKEFSLKVASPAEFWQI